MKTYKLPGNQFTIKTHKLPDVTPEINANT